MEVTMIVAAGFLAAWGFYLRWVFKAAKELEQDLEETKKAYAAAKKEIAELKQYINEQLDDLESDKETT